MPLRTVGLAPAIIALLLVGAGTAHAAPKTGVAKLKHAIAKIERKPLYRQAAWGYAILDARSGRVVAAQNPVQMFDPGSTMKTYSVSTALRLYGPKYRFRTPVYRQGAVNAGTLDGNLVLVGAGDLTLGLRQQPGGRTLAFENLPAIDHSYADQLPGAVLPKGDPMAGLDDLAAQVRASGITQINGDVVVDDRLFDVYDGFPDGLMSAIWVNENLVDLTVTPGAAAGQPATVDPRPLTPAYQVVNRVATVANGKAADLEVSEPTPGTIQISGTIGAGAKPVLRVWEVADPAAFARTAFIQSLVRAGITVTAPATGANPAASLPARDSYAAADRVAEHVSLPLAQYAKLILKVSYNRGADLMTCLAAVRLHSRSCPDGLAGEVRTATDLGVRRSEFIPQDGAGSDDQGRTTPMALARLLYGIQSASYGPTFIDALPILGRDGTLANVLRRAPVAGHSQMKTGNRVVGNAANQIVVLGNSLAGYVDTKRGHRMVFAIIAGNIPIRSSLGFLRVVNDQARMVEGIYAQL
jgi:D-alanyl-D-alanine carboxypeptidase/D-alanyl-D-alanine-endopeptidase (penicillin-binding protein 4)